MDWGVLIVVGAAVWVVMALAVGLLFGRIVRHRDEDDSLPRAHDDDVDDEAVHFRSVA